ncbi:MAG: phosphate acyltransferase PlsX [Anaerolineaceae bacterium]
MALNHACLPIPAPAQLLRYYNRLSTYVKQFNQNIIFCEVKMSIVLDAMGSDEYPVPEILAAIRLKKEFNEEVILVGKKDLIQSKMAELNPENIPLTIVDAPDIVEMTDKPVDSAKKKPNNSMAVGLRMVKEGQADAFVTAGNTGGAYFNAVTILRRIPGISRPALSSFVPTKKGRCVFLDTGANADCRPEFLLEFAVMGTVYAKSVLGIKEPKVALLSNGEEAGKGNELVKGTYPLLQASGLNFYGNVEPKEVFAGLVDVLVTDGFSGNVFLKTSEAVARFFTDLLKEGISARFISKIGYLLAKPAFNTLKTKMDPAEVGAALLLGVNGLVFIGHGRSNARALVSAVKLARNTINAHLLESMKVEIESKLRKNSLI